MALSEGGKERMVKERQHDRSKTTYEGEKTMNTESQKYKENSKAVFDTSESVPHRSSLTLRLQNIVHEAENAESLLQSDQANRLEIDQSGEEKETLSLESRKLKSYKRNVLTVETMNAAM